MARVFLSVLFLFFGIAIARRHDDQGYDTGSEESRGSKDASRQLLDALDRYDLPQGLFPTSLVSSFSIDEEDGSFEMKLDSSCYVKLEDELLWYGEEIKGKMMQRRIEELSGVQARQLLVWLAIKGLHVDDTETGYVYMEIGLTYSRLSAQAFQESPPCTGEEAHLFFR